MNVKIHAIGLCFPGTGVLIRLTWKSCRRFEQENECEAKGLFGFKKTSLITAHLIFVTYHLLLKIPQFSKPHTFGTLFSVSHHSNISTFCGTHT